MKERKLFSDISTAAISVFLSVLLIILTLLSVFVFTFQNISKPNSFAKIAVKSSGAAVYKGYPAFEKALKDYGFEGDKAEKLLKSNAGEAICSLYIKDMSAYLSNDKKHKPVFTKENISLEMIKNLDELVEIITDGISDESEAIAAEGRLVKRIREDTDNLIESVPSAKVVCKSIEDSGYGEFLVGLSNPTILKFLIVIILVLCIGIYTLRYYKFGGFVWLGTNFAIIFAGCLLLTVLSAFGFSGFIISFFINKQALIDAAAGVALSGMIISCVATAILCALCFIAYGICKKRFISKK